MRMMLIMKRNPTKKKFSGERKTVPNQPARNKSNARRSKERKRPKNRK